MKKLNLLLFALLICGISNAQSSAETFRLPAIPYELSWHNTPLSWEVSDGTLSLTGGKGSRLFVDPQRLSRADSAPIALFEPDDTFLFSCKMTVEFNSVFDAGVLMIYADSNRWAKLCFEYAPQMKPMVVSVVNEGLSDDNNHDVLNGNEVYLRIAGLGNGAYAFHYSLDGTYWNMVRYFYLNPDKKLRIGFLSQSPRGESCKTIFSEIKYDMTKLDDIRSGK
jgi:regulation of enolase protein 1 (concanavalin A-like superfamily)